MTFPITRARATLGIVAGFLVALPAAADAPRDQYDRFDGDSATIKDAFTKLEWDRRSVFENINHASAQGGCALPTVLHGVGRLPTLKELLTLFDEEAHEEYEFGKLVPKHIDAVAFPDTPVDKPYWSSTPGAPGTAWTMSFATGLLDQQATNATTLAHARCVL